MTRRNFLGSALAAACLSRPDALWGAEGTDRTAALQAAIDRVTPKDYFDYQAVETQGPVDSSFVALQALEAAFEHVLAGVRDTVVTDRPAVWFLYNMGVVVKTPKSCFSIDLRHRRATELAKYLDFALITHNHGDHYTPSFYAAMNGAKKTVVSNFLDNYTAHRAKGGLGGYTRARKTFKLGDVEVTTMLTDHNSYLVDFTTAFEIRIGDFVLFHSGDCSNLEKLTPACTRPDFWFVHPRCGLKADEGAMNLNPKKTVLLHLNEFGHPRGKARWTWADGFAERAKVEATGHEALVPLWGERLA